MTDARIEIARTLFAGWSSGNPDEPQALMTPDAVLHDTASGTFEGWPAIRAFFAAGLAKWDDLQLLPDEFWANDTGLALHYVMTATGEGPVDLRRRARGQAVVGRGDVVPPVRRRPGVLRGRLPRQGRACPFARDHMNHHVRRCGESVLLVAGREQPAPRAHSPPEPPSLGGRDDDVVVVATEPALRIVRAPRVRGEELALHHHVAVALADDDVGDVMGGRMVGVAEVGADLLDPPEHAGRPHRRVVELGVGQEQLVEAVPLAGVDDVSVEVDQLMDGDDVAGVHDPPF